MTLRDEVWAEVLPTLAEHGQFKISDLDFDESQRHTVRRVLRTMEKLDWLDRVNDRGRIWYAGEKAEQYLTLADDAELLEQEQAN